MFSSDELQRRKSLNERGHWEIPEGLDTSNFDFTWRPDVYERPYIHQFGTQWQKTGGPKFIVPENEGVKYHDFQKAVSLPNQNNRCWRPLVANAVMDYSWHPDETDPPYIYVFGNQWYDCYTMPTFQYRVKDATEKKYITDVKAKLLPNKENWVIPDDIDDSEFDYSWVPNPHEPPLTHEFGTQWQINGGPKYVVTNSVGVKYQTLQKVIKLPNIRNWRMIENIQEGFDYSWHPDNREPAMMYEFGTQWQKAGGPIYVMKNAIHKKYCSDQIAVKTPNPNRFFRPLFSNIEFDYSWHPDPNDPPYIYVFGNQWYGPEVMPTVLYRTPNATEKKYITDVKAKLLPNKENWVIPDDVDDTDFDYSWVPNPREPNYNWQFGTQWQKTGGPLYSTPNAIGLKYTDVQKVIKLPNANNRCWRPLRSNISIDFSWHPDETEPPYIYVFGNQWYDVDVMPTFQYRVSGATEKKYITDVKAKLLPNKENWVIPDDIDDSDFDYSWVPHPEEPDLNWQFGTQWQKTGGPLYVTPKAIGLKYTDVQKVNKLPNYKNWRVIEPINNDAFDYTWHPDSTEENYNYIFGNQFHSGEHMPTLMYKMNNAIGNKYINEIKPQLKIEQIPYEDSIFDAMINHDLSTTYTSISNFDLDPQKIISDSATPYIHIIDNAAAIVPKNAKIKTYDKLEDYPYVKHHVLGHSNTPLDIIFISNGESAAEENYEYLVHLTRNLPNRLHRVKDVYGRVVSQHTAAKLSTTPWYFLINAKCKVNPNFDFSWQPNRMVTRKHYIFTATNPLNNLEYGHMAIVANNKKLTLSTLGTGLDFTLESSNSVINVNSGIGLFNTSEWDTWRTAFREVLKLKYQSHVYHDVESTDRLNIWLSVANGEFAEWAIRGAKDAVEYYVSVNGEFSSLKLSYDWNWLREKFENIKRF